MAGMVVSQRTRQAAVSVEVRMVDGRTVRYGVVAYYHRNPLRRLLFRLRTARGRRLSEGEIGGRSEVPQSPRC